MKFADFVSESSWQDSENTKVLEIVNYIKKLKTKCQKHNFGDKTYDTIEWDANFEASKAGVKDVIGTLVVSAKPHGKLEADDYLKWEDIKNLYTNVEKKFKFKFSPNETNIIDKNSSRSNDNAGIGGYRFTIKDSMI